MNNTSSTLTMSSQLSTLASVTTTSANRQKKYRTLSRIKGLFAVGKSEQDNLMELPPLQLRNELLKKMNLLQTEIEKQNKER